MSNEYLFSRSFMVKNAGNFKKYISTKRHQFSDSECGMYCLYFIIEMLKGRPFSKFNGKKKIKDSQMIRLRKLWFNH